MGLASVTQSSLSGITAATQQVEVAAHNLANTQTTGFKASEVQLATQPNNGGVTVSGIATDFSQGALHLDDRPPLLALEGEGLFLLEGDNGDRLYSRDGRFSLNSAGELVNGRGNRLLGHALDESGQIDRTQLAPLRVRMGSIVEAADGATAKLIGYTVNGAGRLVGKYTDGVQRVLGQVRVARFANVQGLEQRGGNLYRATAASGLPLESDPQTDGAAAVIAGASELSNVDVGEQLIQLSLARTQFRASLAVLNTADELLGALLHRR